MHFYTDVPPNDQIVRLKAFIDKMEMLYSDGAVTPDEFIGCAAVVYKKYESIKNISEITAEIKRITSLQDKQ